MFWGIAIGIFVTNIAIIIGILGNAKENRGAKEVSREMFLTGIAIFTLSVIFSTVI